MKQIKATVEQLEIANYVIAEAIRNNKGLTIKQLSQLVVLRKRIVKAILD